VNRHRLRTQVVSRTLWAACWLAAVPLAEPEAVRASPPFEFGACIHLAMNRSNADTVTVALRQGGFVSFRDDVFWGVIEPQRGVLSFPATFEQLDRTVKSVRAAGGRPLLILDYGNQFYDHGGLVRSPEAMDAFQAYVRFVVSHFGRAVDQYEVWNEWNTGFGSNPKVSAGDPEAYVRLLQRTYQTVKSLNPHALVIGGAVAGSDLSWSKAFFAAGGLQYLDAFSVHSYTLFHLHSNPEVAIRILDLLHTAIRQVAPEREIPVLITEMGWPTNAGHFGVSEDQAAAYLIRFLSLVKARPWIGGVWWYDLIDDGSSDSDAEQRFGLLTTASRPKPSFSAAARMAPLLRDSDGVQSFLLPTGGYAVTGRTPAKEWLIAWKLEPAVRDWPEGIAAATATAGDFNWTEAALPEDGTPVFWVKAHGHWNRQP
jgi:hypothetical protein